MRIFLLSIHRIVAQVLQGNDPTCRQFTMVHFTAADLKINASPYIKILINAEFYFTSNGVVHFWDQPIIVFLRKDLEFIN